MKFILEYAQYILLVGAIGFLIWIVNPGIITSLSEKIGMTIESPIPTLTPTPFPTPTPFVFSEVKLAKLINDWKYSSSGYRYKQSTFLCSISETRSEEANTNWSHSGFSSTRFCSGECTLSEILAKDYHFESEYLDNWLKSPSHRRELDRRYTHFCLKCVQSKSNSFSKVCAAIFGYY